MVSKHTTCKNKTCRRWKHLNPDGYCTNCSPAAVQDEVNVSCSECNIVFTDDTDDEASNNIIGCDLCKAWFHITCIGSNELSPIVNDPDYDKVTIGELRWFCQPCNLKLSDWINKVSTTPSSVNNQYPETQSAHSDSALHPATPEIAVCEEYKRGKCPHGISGKRVVAGKTCSLRHPKLCKRFLKNGPNSRYGCKQGDKCTHFHPILCRNSVQKRLCLNQTCTFMHIKGTKRINPIQSVSGFTTDYHTRKHADSHRYPPAGLRYRYRQERSQFRSPDGPQNPNQPTANDENHFLITLMNQMQAIQEKVCSLESTLSFLPNYHNPPSQWSHQAPAQQMPTVQLDPKHPPNQMFSLNQANHQPY